MTRDEKDAEIVRLTRLLEKATTRLEILQGRMRACPALSEDGRPWHALSVWEIGGWIEEQKSAPMEQYDPKKHAVL